MFSMGHWWLSQKSGAFCIWHSTSEPFVVLEVKLTSTQQISLLDTWEGNYVIGYSLVGVTPCSIVVYCLRLGHACCSISNVFDYTENRGNIFLRNVGCPVTVYVKYNPEDHNTMQTRMFPATHTNTFWKSLIKMLHTTIIFRTEWIHA